MPEPSAHIQIHARKAITKTLGTTWVGYLTVQNGPCRSAYSTQIHRLTRADALADAVQWREEAWRVGQIPA